MYWLLLLQKNTKVCIKVLTCGTLLLYTPLYKFKNQKQDLKAIIKQIAMLKTINNTSS